MMVVPEQPRPAPLHNRVRALWQAGTPSISAILTIPSVPTVQVLAHAGFDSLVVDMEHGPIDLATAHAMITATAGTPAVPYARLPANLPWLAKPLLDAGVLGVRRAARTGTRLKAEAHGKTPCIADGSLSPIEPFA